MHKESRNFMKLRGLRCEVFEDENKKFCISASETVTVVYCLQSQYIFFWEVRIFSFADIRHLNCNALFTIQYYLC